MAALVRLPFSLVVALIALAGCNKRAPERQAAPPDAGPPTLTGATVPPSGADASVDAAVRADTDAAAARRDDVVRVSPFGATIEDAGDDRGATGTRVAPGSQAASILRPGDVVTAVDLVRVKTANELAFYLERAKGIVTLTVERDGTSRYVVLTTG